MKVAYARVSTQEQSLDLQRDALSQSGCEKIFEDVASGAKDDRAGLQEAIEFLRAGDTLVVWKLDRLGRSLQHLIQTINELNSRGVGFQSLHESLDTATPGGKLVFHIFAALAEFELAIIRERTKSGLLAARARGRVGGRPRCLDEQKRTILKALASNGELSVEEVCRTMGISRASYYRFIKAK